MKAEKRQEWKIAANQPLGCQQKKKNLFRNLQFF